MLNFVILWEGRGFFRFFNFVKNAQFCHFVRGLLILSLLQFCQKWSILSFCERPVYFFRVFNYVKNTQFLQFCERTVDFFNSSILSKMLNFVIFREAPGFFFHFFNFVKNCPFCHLWKVDFKLWDKNKYTICTLCVVIYQTILSKRLNFVILWEDRGFLRFFNFVILWKRKVYFFFTFSILSKMVHFVIFEKWTSNYEISISILCVHYVLWYINLFL